MKNIIKALAVLALSLTGVCAFAGTHYGKLTTVVANQGMGEVYAGTSSSAGTYSATESSATASGSEYSLIRNYVDLTFYAFARAYEGYEFLGWGTSASATSYSSTASPYTVTVRATASSSGNPTTQTYYAIFGYGPRYGKLQASVASGSSGMGTVSASASNSAGSYSSSSTVTLSKKGNGNVNAYLFARPNDGYVFLGWSTTPNATSYSSTSSPYTVQVNVDAIHETDASTTTYYAMFAPDIRYVKLQASVASGSSGRGTVSASASVTAGSYGASSTVTLSRISAGNVGGYLFAQANEGYIFAGWSTSPDASSYSSSSSPYSVQVNATATSEGSAGTVTYYAYFDEIVCRLENGQEFTSLEAAYLAAGATNEITILKDMTVDYFGTDANKKIDIVIPAGRDVVIDLKGHQVTSDITATGKVTITDSTDAKTGKLIGDINDDGGTIILDYGTFTYEIGEEWLAPDRIIVYNYNGTRTVTDVSGESDIHNCTLDTRLGVRLVNDPAEDIIPLTYASSNFVYRMSEDYAKNTFVGVAPAYPPAPLTDAEWHNGLTNVSSYADSDHSYDYPTGNWRITHDPFVEVYNGPGEASVVWQEWCWGLIEAVHSNQCGVIRAWYKFPDPQFRVTQRDSTTRSQQKTEGSVSDGNVYWYDETGTDQNKNKYDIELSYKYLEDNYKFSRIGGDKEDSMDSLEKIRDHLDDWCDNGLRVWENLVTGTDPDSPYVADVDPASAGAPDDGTGSGGANPNNFVTSIPSVSGTDDYFGYDYWYDLRRATNWWNLVADTRDKTPRKVVPLYADDNDNVRDPTGLYKVFTLIVPDTRKAITNEIPTKNVIGVLKVESTMTNTMVNIPWKSLAHDPEFLLPQTVVSNLTKTTNLDVGDRVYVLDGNYKNGDPDATDNDFYQAWILNADYKWQPMNTIKVNEYGTNSFTQALSPEQKQLFRGGGVWVVRDNPTRIDPATGKEVAKPFFIYGQFETNNVSTTINGSSSTELPVYTMLGIPGIYGIDINNDIDWGNNPIEDTDVITIPRETAEPLKLRWKVINGEGSWGYTQTTRVRVGNRWSNRSVRVTDIQVPRGHAFWYTRRGPAFNFTWKLDWPKAGLEEYFGWEKYPEESKPNFDPPAVIGD